jgi:hypothetical protein
MYTSSIYSGDMDNHPLISWHNDILDLDDPYYKVWTTEDDYKIGNELMLADLAMESEDVSPEDWEGGSQSEERRMVRDRVHSSRMLFHPPVSLHMYPGTPSPPIIELPVIHEGHSMYPTRHEAGIFPTDVRYNKIIKDEIQEFLIGDKLNHSDGSLPDESTHYDLPASIDYRNPEEDPSVVIRYNAWNPRITYLRRIRVYFTLPRGSL